MPDNGQEDWVGGCDVKRRGVIQFYSQFDVALLCLFFKHLPCYVHLQKAIRVRHTVTVCFKLL